MEEGRPTFLIKLKGYFVKKLDNYNFGIGHITEGGNLVPRVYHGNLGSALRRIYKFIKNRPLKEENLNEFSEYNTLKPKDYVEVDKSLEGKVKRRLEKLLKEHR